MLALVETVPAEITRSIAVVCRPGDLLRLSRTSRHMYRNLPDLELLRATVYERLRCRREQANRYYRTAEERGVAYAELELLLALACEFNLPGPFCHLYDTNTPIGSTTVRFLLPIIYRRGALAILQSMEERHVYLPTIHSGYIWAGQASIPFLRYVMGRGYISKPTDAEVEDALHRWFVYPGRWLPIVDVAMPPSTDPAVEYVSFLLDQAPRNLGTRLQARICRRALELDDIPMCRMLKGRLPDAMQPRKVYGDIASSEAWELVYSDMVPLVDVYQQHHILHNAVRLNNVALTRRVLSALEGIPVPQGLESYLTLAVEHGNLAVARVLLDAGASVAGMGQAMQKALMEGNDKVVELLVARGLTTDGIDRRVWNTCFQRGFGWMVEKYKPPGEADGPEPHDPRSALRLRNVLVGDYIVACAEDGSPWVRQPTIAKVAALLPEREAMQLIQFSLPTTVFKPVLAVAGRKARALKSTDILPVDTLGRFIYAGADGQLYDDDRGHFFRIYSPDMVFARRKQDDGKFFRGWAYREECT